MVNELENWPRDLRRGSINSFGFGGANAHAILESFESYMGGDQKYDINDEVLICDQVLVLPISAATSKSLDTRLKQTTEFIRGSPHDPNILPRLALTLTERRSHLQQRSFLLVEPCDGTSGFEISTPQSPRNVTGTAPLLFAFVFTGQGAQYAEMAKDLCQQNPKFLATIRQLDQVLKTLPSDIAPAWTLEQTIQDPPEVSRVSDARRSQPLCTAIQVAIVDLLRAWGVSPAAVIGHSSGEIAAAYSAGLISSEQAIIVAYLRGYSVAQIDGQGCMLAAGISANTAQDLIKDRSLDHEVCVACVNSPESVTLSGSLHGIDVLMEALKSTNKFARKIDTGGRAYHSHFMKGVGSLYEGLLTPHLVFGQKNRSLVAPFYSTVGSDGNKLNVISHFTPLPAKYWRENLESPVQFSSGLSQMVKNRELHILEIGPHSALKGPIDQIRSSLGINKQALPYHPTLLRNQSASVAMKTLAGSLFLHNHEINWHLVNRLPENSRALQPLHQLPPYPWDYSSGLLWSEPRASVELRNRQHVRHELLGSRQLAGNGIDWTWRNLLRPREIKWMQDHKVEGQVVFPAAGYLALAIEGLSQILDISQTQENVVFSFKNVNIPSALVVHDEDQADDAEAELHTTIAQSKISTANASATWYSFSISSWAAGQATVHCTGSLKADVSNSPESPMGIDEIVNVENTDGFDHWAMDKWYSKLNEEGLCFGPKFRTLLSLQTDSNRVRTEAISITQLVQRDQNQTNNKHEEGTYYVVHPLVIDACLQGAIMGSTAGNLSLLKAYLPVFITNCHIRKPSPLSINRQSSIHTRSITTGPARKQVDCTLRDPTGVPVISLTKVHLTQYQGKTTQVEAGLPESTSNERHPCLRISWKPDILRFDVSSRDVMRDYVSAFTTTLEPDAAEDETMATITALLDLAGHKNPKMRILELGSNCDCKSKYWLEALATKSAFPQCRSWSRGNIDKEGNPDIDNSEKGPFDLVLIPSVSKTSAIKTLYLTTYSWRRRPECGNKHQSWLNRLSRQTVSSSAVIRIMHIAFFRASASR